MSPPSTAVPRPQPRPRLHCRAPLWCGPRPGALPYRTPPPGTPAPITQQAGGLGPERRPPPPGPPRAGARPCARVCAHVCARLCVSVRKCVLPCSCCVCESARVQARTPSGVGRSRWEAGHRGPSGWGRVCPPPRAEASRADGGHGAQARGAGAGHRRGAQGAGAAPPPWPCPGLPCSAASILWSASSHLDRWLGSARSVRPLRPWDPPCCPSHTPPCSSHLSPHSLPRW